MSIDCTARIEAEGDYLHAIRVREFVASLPDGAVISAVIKDFGNQRDPEPRLVGLRASWSEER